MRSNSSFLNRIPNSTILMSILILISFKIIIFLLIKNNVINFSLGGGSDAGYYDAYAEGYINVSVNIWAVILRALNDYNLYSREGISYIFFLLNVFVIPILAISTSGISYKHNQKNYLYMFLLCSIYPTLFYYTFDIYRDVFMVFIFLIGCLVVRFFLNTNKVLSSVFYLSISIMIGLFLIDLRPYLGYTFLISLFLWKIRFTKKRLIFYSLLYLLILFVANYVGILDGLTEYRSGFELSDGGSTLGLTFSNPLMFIPNLILSALGQLLGLYITNPIAVGILLLESFPFIFMSIYIIKNIRLADEFSRFLIIFFVLYASVWLIGNDNLGTALRLRFYNYLSVYICFFHILKLKKLSLVTA
ncbi:hypothetical protein H4W00_002265 [Psychrobacter sp. PL19]|uniref:hypothetical protein n=1 Tax=Psychrobacter sp. PL19 TaxID=2760711 RepID=UPI001AEA5CD6